MNNTSTKLNNLDVQGHTLWAVVFSIVTCAIIISNVLTLTVFFKTRLQRVRKRTHYLLISLTCADLLVGCLSSPLFIWDLTHPLKHRGDMLHQATHDSIDIVSGFASILSLAAIAIERFVAVRWPLKHRSATKSFYIVSIATPWLIAVLIALLYVLGFVISVLPSYTLSVTAVICITSALVVITASYTFIRKRVTSSNWRPQAPIMDRERKLTQTLMTITCVSLLTWLPFEILLIVVHFCSICREPLARDLSSVNFTFKLLQFSNSFLNSFFYTLRIPEYKKALYQLFKLPCLQEMDLPNDQHNSARLTSFKRYIRSPLISKTQAGTVLSVDYAIRNAGQLSGNIMACSSPLIHSHVSVNNDLCAHSTFTINK